MIGAILQILLGMPLGVFAHRFKIKAAIAYLFSFILIITAISLMYPARVLEAISSVTLAEYFLGLLQNCTGVGIGVLISLAEKHLHKPPQPITISKEYKQKKLTIQSQR